MITKETMRAIEKDFRESYEKYREELKKFQECATQPDPLDFDKLIFHTTNIQTIYNEELSHLFSFMNHYSEPMKRIYDYHKNWYEKLEKKDGIK